MKNIFIATVVLFLFAPVLAQKKMTDREFDGFKGEVKSVVIEEAEVVETKGKKTEKRRKKTGERYYDKSGNLIKTLEANSGYLTTYMFIDGDKISKTIATKANTPLMTTDGDPNLYGKKQPADKRYDNKFKYKYDAQGHIIEEELYQNTGALLTKHIYEYDDKGRRIKKSYYYKGKLNSTETYRFDDQGVEIEGNFNLAATDGKTSTVDSYSYYQFDAKDNWIKRTTTTTFKSLGSITVYKINYYRKITYYEK